VNSSGGALSAIPIALALAALFQGGCVPKVGPGVADPVERLEGDGPVLELTYMGTGGWIIRRGDEAVMGAPLFSNPSFVRVGLAPIEADTGTIDRMMDRFDVRDTRAILIGHSHYDHLMDVPRVAARHVPDARLIGGRTTQNLLGHWSGVMDRVDLVDDHVADQESAGSWMSYGGRLRVLPLRSNHAPHFVGMELYAGTADRPRTEPPGTAAEWLGGETYAFLIDFLDEDGGIEFRVYYQDAVTAPPLGFAPEERIEERPVDVAILVPATFDQVDWHPEAFIENLRPRWVLLGHWEDFFIPIDEDTHSITMADIGHFEARLRRVFEGEFWRPEVGTRFRFRR
jgi:L-ascorbate metabolism protein UlaG (beta-lactamase superfamily)